MQLGAKGTDRLDSFTITDDLRPTIRDTPALPAEQSPDIEALRPRIKARRVIARLPVPRPLPHAVAAGVFGQDENGPVHPSADEVREITQNHAGTIIALLEVMQDAQRRGLPEQSVIEHQESLKKEIAITRRILVSRPANSCWPIAIGRQNSRSQPSQVVGAGRVDGDSERKRSRPAHML